MTQKTDPFIQQAWGWSTGEDGWGLGMNNNLITYAFFHNRRYNGSLSTTGDLPSSPTDGDAYFVTGDNIFYFRAEGVWYSTIPPVGMTFVLKTNEAVYKFTGSALILDTKSISDVTGLQAALDSKLNASQKGAVNGVAPLGGDSKIPSTYLPEGGSYLGTWNASTNTPTITSGLGLNGDFYKVSVGGTTTVDGESSWSIGDEVRFNGTVWQRIPNTGGVSSVNGETGSVILSAEDVDATPSSHIGSGGAQHANATTSVAGFLSSTDKTKLDGIATGATANQTNSYLLSRANHTGSQAQSTITNLVTDLSAKQATLVSGTNIKTINGASILGSGDIVISGGGGGTTFTALTDTPSSYTGNAEKAVVVKLDESGLEFVSLGTAAFSNSGDFATESHTHDNATTSLAGFMSAADKTKLNNIQAGAEVNVNADWNSVSGDSQILNKPTLGTAAAANLTTSSTDNTSGSVLKVGDGGWLGIGRELLEHDNPSNELPSCFFLTSASTANRPANISTVGINLRRNSGGNEVRIQGSATDGAEAGRLFYSYRSTGNFQNAEIFHSHNQISLGKTSASARGALELGDSASASIVSSSTDSTSGRVLNVGYYGIGTIPPQLSDFNTDPSQTTGYRTGFFYTASGASNLPFGQRVSGVSLRNATSGSEWRLGGIATDNAEAGRIFYSYRATSGFQHAEMFHSHNQLNIGKTSSAARSALELANIASSGSASDLVAGTVPNARLTAASTSTAGIVQLNNTTSSTSTTQAATANAVKVTFDLANGKQNALGYTPVQQGTGVDQGSNVIKIGWGTDALLKVTVDSTNVGDVAFRAWVEGTFATETFARNASNLTTGTVNNARLTSASTSAAGIVQLNNTTSSTSTTQAATANAVKTVNDGLTGKVDKSTPSQTFQNIGSGSGSRTINAANGIHVLATATGNTTWTFPSPASTEAHALTLELTNGGAFTMTWPAGTRWAGGVAPTLTASGTDILVFTKAGTAAWRGYLSSKDNK